MREQSALLRRQAEEQRRLRDLSWPDKERLIERAREDIVTLKSAKVMRGASRGSEAEPHAKKRG